MAKVTKDKRYRNNPFRADVISHTLTGVRTIYGSPNPNSKDTFAVVSKTTGEDLGSVAFGKCIKVDKTDFVKLYASGVRMFLNLKPAGIKVFMIIYDYLMSNWQAESVVLIYDLLNEQEKKDISTATFFRGIKDLIEANFLAPAIQAGTYWINTDYVFRGNRLTLVNQYIMEPPEPKEEPKEIES